MSAQQAVSSVEVGPGGDLQPYKPRVFDCLGLWQEGRWQLKAYGIHCDLSRKAGSTIDAGVAAAARSHVRGRLREADAEGHDHGVGFVIIHQGILANWLLLHWWTYGNICCEALSRSLAHDPETFTPYSGSAMACVWELEAIGFERRAWIQHVLCEAPSLDNYLAVNLEPGTY